MSESPPFRFMLRPPPPHGMVKSVSVEDTAFCLVCDFDVLVLYEWLYVYFVALFSKASPFSSLPSFHVVPS